jgi:GMP synthase-like glutamine amidotransferase
MKPILICQFYPSEGAGYLAIFLNERHIKWQLLRIDQNEALPKTLDNYSALVMMGGPMSVNDDLPWIKPLMALIQQAHTNKMPVLGHCLGGQLIAKALGATVSANPVKEIGWGLVNPSYNKIAQAYFGDLPFTAFHWHGETFSLPDGATHLLSSPYCENQAFAISNTLSLQCHIEMTSEMIKEWCITDIAYLTTALNSPAVQKPEVMQTDMENRLMSMRVVADRVYHYWLKPIYHS